MGRAQFVFKGNTVSIREDGKFWRWMVVRVAQPCG